MEHSPLAGSMVSIWSRRRVTRRPGATGLACRASLDAVGLLLDYSTSRRRRPFGASNC